MIDKNESNDILVNKQYDHASKDLKEPSKYHKMKKFLDKVEDNPKYNNFMKKIVNNVDYSIDFIMNEHSNYQRNEIIQIARKPILFGIWVSFITFIICGLWAAIAPINSAAIAQGTVTLNADKKIIQHLEGGIVSKILVKNGDTVKKGQTLIILDDTRARTSLESSLSQFRTLKANEIRLIAERDDQKELNFSNDIFDLSNPEIIKLIDTQKILFKTRREALNGKIESIKKRVEQQKKVIDSFESQLNSAKLQLKYNNEQLETTQKLLDKGQGIRPKLLELQSRVAHYEGNIGEYTAKIAQATHSISEQEIEIINYRTDFLNNIIKKLKETQSHIAQIEEEVKSKTDILDRININAPQDGIVNDLQIHTIGAVIQPHSGQKLLEIIPQDDKLVIDAQIRPEDIDLVNENMIASVKLLAGKSRTTPSLDGVVTYVSAETVPSRLEGGRPYYHATIEIDETQFEKKKLKRMKLYPGMPAQIFIITGSRSLLKYLVNQLTDSMEKAFRER